MTYVSGVLVERSRQSMRPREPAPPGRTITISSRMMSTRMLRPRENNAINGLGAAVVHVTAKAAADRYLTLIGAHRGQQRYLEDLLKQIGVDMKKVQTLIKALSLQCQKSPTAQCRTSLAHAQKQLLQLQADANACINAIKACAAKANAAAAAAVENGATPSEIQAANTSAGTSSGSANISTPPVSTATSTSTSRQAAYDTAIATRQNNVDTVTADVAPTEAVIETNTPSVTPNGALVPGGDAKVVEVPVMTETGKAAPVSMSGGLTLGKVAFGAALIWGGGKLLKFW